MLFGVLTHRSKKLLLDGGQDRTNPLAVARGDKTVMRPFTELLWTFIIVLTESTGVGEPV